ncbi:unnamed protein product [Paramecium pentaurelia]|uniref:Uncharacterized protein n=1 Tax=Paramecium pentaurelia TaxID=43138 RepID=A0A8S1YN12_9CILI|nr:unnamed protein product [Paramecium pentaurelia]
MFEQDYYKRIIDKQTTPNKCTINTAKPWFPQLKHRLAVKDYDYKFFVLPPNKMVSLLKKQKINVPSDEQIREFLRNHSLKHIVQYDTVDFKNVDKICASNSPSPLMINKKNRKLFMQQNPNTNYKLIEPKPQTAQKAFDRQSSVQYSRVRELKSQQLEIRPNRENMEIEVKGGLKRKLRIHEISAKSTPNIDATNLKFFAQSNRKRNRRRIELLRRSLKKIKLLGLSIVDVIQKQVFSKKAFSSQFSKEFIFASKQNRLEQMQSFLLTHPYLVFQYDYYNMTALHWACKYGYLDMVRMLLHYHADFDALDLMNRTPLSIAITENHQEIVKLLLTHGAYPWSTGLTDLNGPLQRNPELKKIVGQARKIQLFTKWSRLEQPTLCIY